MSRRAAAARGRARDAEDDGSNATSVQPAAKRARTASKQRRQAEDAREDEEKNAAGPVVRLRADEVDPDARKLYDALPAFDTHAHLLRAYTHGPLLLLMDEPADLAGEEDPDAAAEEEGRPKVLAPITLRFVDAQLRDVAPPADFFTRPPAGAARRTAIFFAMHLIHAVLYHRAFEAPVQYSRQPLLLHSARREMPLSLGRALSLLAKQHGATLLQPVGESGYAYHFAVQMLPEAVSVVGELATGKGEASASTEAVTAAASVPAVSAAPVLPATAPADASVAAAPAPRKRGRPSRASAAQPLPAPEADEDEELVDLTAAAAPAPAASSRSQSASRSKKADKQQLQQPVTLKQVVQRRRVPRAGSSAPSAQDDLDRRIEQAVNDLLDSRSLDKTICPSEAARRVAGEQRGGDDWRALMEPVRAIVGRMVTRGEVQVTQHGQVVDLATVRGPIRVRRVR